MRIFSLFAAIFICSCTILARHPEKIVLQLEAREVKIGNYDLHFRAVIKGDVPPVEKYYCLDQLWEFGNGHSVHVQHKCAPFEEIGDAWISRPGYHFFYRYHKPGKHKVRLTLLREDKSVLRSNTIVVHTK